MKLKKTFLAFSILLFFSCPPQDPIEEDINLKPVTYELLSFVYTEQTDDIEDALSFEIEYFNANNFDIYGYPKITVDIGGGVTSTYTPNSQCRTILANSSCILTYNEVDDNPNLKPELPIQFLDASYLIYKY